MMVFERGQACGRWMTCAIPYIANILESQSPLIHPGTLESKKTQLFAPHHPQPNLWFSQMEKDKACFLVISTPLHFHKTRKRKTHINVGLDLPKQKHTSWCNVVDSTAAKRLIVIKLRPPTTLHHFKTVHSILQTHMHGIYTPCSHDCSLLLLP